MNREKMQRVWLINHYAVPPSEAGSGRHYTFAKQLLSLDWEMTIFASNVNHFTGGKKEISKSFYKKEIIREVCFYWIRTPSYRGNSLMRICNMLVYSLGILMLPIFMPYGLNKPDVIIGSTIHPFAAYAAWLVSRIIKVPFIFEIRDLWPETLIIMGKIGRNSPTARILFFLEKNLLENSNAIITTLPNLAEYVIKRGLRALNITWVPNGVDLSEYDRSANICSEKTIGELPLWGFIFMYIGSFGNANDLETLIKAFSIFEKKNRQLGAGLILIGDGPARADIEKMAEDLRISRILFKGILPKEHIPQAAKLADAFIITVPMLPKLYKYGISMNKLFDYMASGKPTIIATCIDDDPVSASGGGIRVPAEDEKTLSDGMAFISSISSEQRKTMGASARRYVENNHSYKYITNSLVQVLNEVIQSS